MHSLMSTYGDPSTGGVGVILYGLTTSGGMIGLITSMVGGILAAVLSLVLGATGGLPVWIGVAGAVVVFAVLAVMTTGSIARNQSALPVMFPALAEDSGSERRPTA
jgi:hypothetical protein